MKKRVSIIIPVYNVEKFILKTVESVINQDYKNVEIILVDDGSPDNSAQIIDELAEKDNRIICLHKENGGVSSASNAGLKIATGEYVTFIDGDDWVEPNYISYLLNLVEKNKCEIGMNINNFSDYSMNSSDKEYVVKAEKAIEWIYLGDIFVAVWNKIYKMSFLKDNHILFDEKIWYGEGMLFNIDCLQFVDKVAVGEKSVYHQVSNPNSAMRKFNVESNLCGIRSLEIQKDHWKKSNPAIVDAWNYHRRAFNLSIARGLLKSNMEKEYQELYNSCIHNLRSHLWVSLKVPISLREKLSYVAWAIIPEVMSKRCKKRKLK
jgi:glycosyltransferase involved in cell wall biosynthesis